MSAPIETRDYGYGFQWGPMWVTRLATFKRGGRDSRVLGINTDHHKVEVYVSSTGRSVRVWVDGKEATA